MLLFRAARSLKEIVQHRFTDPLRQLPFSKRIGIPWQSEPSSRRLVSQLRTNLPGPAFSRSRLSSRPSFSQSVSPVSRHAARFSAPCLPRPPRVPGHVAHVGLGTARNFSTARPIFQHLIENVPVAARASYEIDWDLKMREQRRQSFALGQDKNTSKSKHAVKPAHQVEPYTTSIISDAEDVEHYFQTLATPSITTYLQIPLAPTPTSRVPLSSSLPAPPRLLPLSAVAREHALHSKHALRVSSLFRRLDAARVWERGASCETYGDPSGLCTVLRVKFEDWTEDMVRQVLGLAGRDWCSIQQITTESRDFEVLEDFNLSDVTPMTSHEETLHDYGGTYGGSSTDLEFVMPTVNMPVGFEWDTATSSWASLPLRSNSPPMFEAECGYSSSSESEWEYTSAVSPDWVTECSPSNSRSTSSSPGWQR